MDDFTIYGSSFNACLKSLNMILERCIETDLILNYELILESDRRGY